MVSIITGGELNVPSGRHIDGIAQSAYMPTELASSARLAPSTCKELALISEVVFNIFKHLPL